MSTVLTPEGFRPLSGNRLRIAVARLLRWLYPTPKPRIPRSKSQTLRDARDSEIRRLFAAGERVVDIAAQLSMTIQGIYKSLRRTGGVG